MDCVLCHVKVDLFDLDDEGYAGLPAHKVCADAARAELGRVLDEAKAMVLAEVDPRRHRNHLRPASAA